MPPKTRAAQPAAPPVADPLADLREAEPDAAGLPPTNPAPEPPAPPPFTFDLRGDEEDPLATLVHLAVGAASMCWENVAQAGVFDDAKARDVAAALLHALRPGVLMSPAQQDDARAVMVAAWHADTTVDRFVHKGGVCGCNYLAGVTVRAILPAVVTEDDDTTEV